MQADNIVVTYEEAHDGVTSELTLSRYEETQNKTVYVAGNHTPAHRDQLAITRSFPTKNGNFKGVQKSGLKLTKDLEVPGVDQTTTITAPIIIDVAFSIPVGTSPASVLEARQKAVGILNLDSFMDKLNIQQMV